jgi:FAD/FMN-containing dehydrogenase
LPLAIRGGGHNIAGSAVCDDGLVIDLSRMKSVRVDPFARRAFVEPGCTLGDLDHETQAFGLAVPVGINSTHGKPMIAFAVCYTGPIENGPHAVDAVRRFGSPSGEQLGSMPFTAWQQAFDQPLVPGNRNYWKSHNLSELPDGLIDTLIDTFRTLDATEYEVFFGQIGGATARIAVDATAYPARDTIYVMNIHARWSEPKDDARSIAWARMFFENTKPFALGSVYVNFMTEEETDRIGSAYGPNYQRLVAVKNRYDPDNLFRKNQNIKPSGAT